MSAPLSRNVDDNEVCVLECDNCVFSLQGVRFPTVDDVVYVVDAGIFKLVVKRL